MNPQGRFAQSIILILLTLLCVANTHAAVNINYVVNNHLGAPVLLVDQNQHVVWQAEYDEFGKATILVEEVEFNVRFPGQYYDKETGLTYNYYRDYNQDLGRYVQSDPIGLRGGINTYGYVGGNPVSYVDSTGESAVAAAELACELNPIACAAAGSAALFCALNPDLCGAVAQACVNAAVKLSDTMGAQIVTATIVAGIISESRGKNRIPDKGEPGTVGTNGPGTTKKKYGDDGWVEKEWNKGHGPSYPENEQGDHIHDHTPAPQNPTGKPTRGDGRPRTPEDLNDMGF